jgi:tRNA threonylcarbamoyladenosine biosynthesis protein TsaE
MPELTCQFETASPEATRKIARHLAQALQPGDFLALVGELGAGKTCFVQGLAEGLGVSGRVASPTFILMRAHPGPVTLFHADAYRLNSGGELLDIGLEDWLATGVVALEWADQAPEALPAEYLTVTIAGDGELRRLTFAAHGPRGEALLEHMRSCAS